MKQFKTNLVPLGRRRFSLSASPAEGVEHVAEGDGDVDEDDQRKQGI